MPYLNRIRFIALFLGLASGAYAQHRYAFAHPQMGTTFHLVFYSNSDSTEAARIARQAFDYVDTLNYLFSDYIPDSELNRLSDLAGSGQKMKISGELYEILHYARHFSKVSNGAFDITVGAVTRLWRRARHLKEVPDSVRVLNAANTVHYPSVRLYRHHKAALTRKGTRLDLGGIAQGYAADKCLEILRTHHIEQALADAGGDIAIGAPPPNMPGWVVERPQKSEDGTTYYEKLFLSHCGITTSGATYRYLEHNGIRYSHIVDPRTGWGLTHGNLVTVQAPNALTADAWATAISVLGANGWAELKKKPEIQVWIQGYPLR